MKTIATIFIFLMGLNNSFSQGEGVLPITHNPELIKEQKNNYQTKSTTLPQQNNLIKQTATSIYNELLSNMKLFFLQISALTAVAVSATINNEVMPKQKVSSSIGEGDAMIQGVRIAFV